VPQNKSEHLLRNPLPVADAMHGWAASVGLAVLVGLVYFLAARLSLALLTKPDGVAVFWPASGIAAGAMIALGPAARLPVAAGAMIGTIMAGMLDARFGMVVDTLFFALCNAAEALIAAALIGRYFGPHFSLDSLRQVLGLVAAAAVGTAISGVGGTFAFKYFYSTPAPVLTTWQHWFAADALGILTVAPLLIGLASAARERPSRSELIEGLAALAALTLMSWLVISLPREPWATVVPIALLFPVLLWLAARCRPVFAAAAAFIVAFTIVWTTTFGIGIFGDPSFAIADRILGAQAGILAVSLCALVLAALFAERRRHEAVLAESETQLQEALTAGAVTAFDWNIRTGLSRRSRNAAQILGLDPNQSLTANDFLARVNPDDRPHLGSLVHGLSPDRPSYSATFRFIRPDGREVWLEEAARAEFDAAGRRVRLKGLTLDISERKRTEERQDLLMAELDHRVKNVLARVAVAVTHTGQDSRSMGEFVSALNGRIRSMAAAHSLLSQSRWHRVGLADVVRGQLAPYTTETNTTISGPDVMLTPVATQAVAMVFHELVTNAAKYGALSSADGRVSVTWQRNPGNGGTAPKVAIVWREMAGLPIAAPTHSGFGSSLISDLIPQELGGNVEIVFSTDGMCCNIEFPLAAS
jgi:PAS domain S-box-containing protein